MREGGGAGRGGSELHHAGDALGRYVVLEPIGEGGMGAVYAAYDPSLDRRVALKVLRASSESVSSMGSASLVREAKAMARLSHPNVIQVFEVGTFEASGDVFIAMEFVEGQSLREWLAGGDRSWTEIVEVFRQAGRGLAHAHEHGVVHRDFKPDNCLLDHSGRVRVIDFGIAHTEAVPRAGEARPRAEGGEVAGTPAYMAPEQLEGIAIPATDQFAFGVALYEALYGQHPFGGATVFDRSREASEGHVREVPEGGPDVPTWVHEAVVTALAADPADRHPSLPAMVEALEPRPWNPMTSRRVQLGIGVAIALLAFGGVLVGTYVGAPAEPRACEGLDAHLRGVWDEPTRDGLEAGLREAGAREATVDRVVDRLGRRAADWIEMRRVACEDTRVRGEVSEATMDLRMACLDHRLAEMRSTVSVLAEADGSMAHRALQLVAELPPLDRCADIGRLEAEAGSSPPADIAPRVRQIRARLARARALWRAGAYEPAGELSGTLLEEARELGFDPLLAEALRAHGQILGALGEHAEARPVLLEATTVARRCGAAALETEAWIDLVYSDLTGFGERERAAQHAEYARAVMSHVGEDPALRARLELATAQALMKRDRTEEALRHLQLAERLLEATGDDGWRVAIVHETEASALRQLGRTAEAIELHRRALRELTASVGDDHPNVGLILGNLALALRHEGQEREARRTLERALELKRRTLGQDHPATLRSLLMLADQERRLGELRAADRHYREAARAITARRDNYTLLRHLDHGRASLAEERGDHAAAAELLEGVRQRAAERDHDRDRWSAQIALGLALLRADRPAEAEPLLREALSQVQENEISGWPLAMAQVGVGMTLTEAGRPREALDHIEPGLRSLVELSANRETLGLARYALARALLDAGQDRTRAEATLRQAVEDLREVGHPGAWLLPRAERALRELSAP